MFRSEAFDYLNQPKQTRRIADRIVTRNASGAENRDGSRAADIGRSPLWRMDDLAFLRSAHPPPAPPRPVDRPAARRARRQSLARVATPRTAVGVTWPATSAAAAACVRACVRADAGAAVPAGSFGMSRACGAPRRAGVHFVRVCLQLAVWQKHPYRGQLRRS